MTPNTVDILMTIFIIVWTPFVFWIGHQEGKRSALLDAKFKALTQAKGGEEW